MNKYDRVFEKLTSEQSKELASKINGGMGTGKRPAQKTTTTTKKSNKKK